jgi:hypothetical protein
MPGNEQKRMNALLADPDQVNVAHLLQDGRIGLFVVASLARRHGIAVRLQSNIYGGTQAVLVLPQSLLGADTDAPTTADAVPVPPPGPVHRSPAQDATAQQRKLSAAPNRQAPVPSRPLRLHQTPQQPRRQGEGPPLPLRVERVTRPTPADARPGIQRPDDALPALRPEPGTVRGTMGRPQLPRRAHQEHLVPQLREAPTPRAEDEEPPLHDPGLMASFRRGIELADARNEADADTAQPPADTAQPPAGALDASGPPARQPLEPLPVRGSTATASPLPLEPDPLETHNLKE